MRVVMVSKALVVGAYQRKLEELARLGEIELTAVVPPEWRDRRSHVKLERAHTTGYELVVAPLLFAGQYHLHFYPTLGAILKRARPDIVHMDEEPYNLATWHGLRLAEAKPESPLSLAVPRVRGGELPPRRPRHRGQPDRRGCPDGQRLPWAGGSHPTVRGRPRHLPPGAGGGASRKCRRYAP
jgi:hypothetical protein